MKKPLPFCDCEHEAHFNVVDEERQPHQHRYGAAANDGQLVDTVFGEYWICNHCQQDHPVPADMLRSEEPEWNEIAALDPERNTQEP